VIVWDTGTAVKGPVKDIFWNKSFDGKKIIPGPIDRI
jgi:hypothetical protein